jgi:hypothetical protein
MRNLYGTTDTQHLRIILFAKTLPDTDWDLMLGCTYLASRRRA